MVCVYPVRKGPLIMQHTSSWAMSCAAQQGGVVEAAAAATWGFSGRADAGESGACCLHNCNGQAAGSRPSIWGLPEWWPCQLAQCYCRLIKGLP